MVRIVLDAMGGDHAPDSILEGVSLSLSKDFARPDEIVLVGQQDVLAEKLARYELEDRGVTVVDAPDVLTRKETPVEAMRKKPGSSISVGLGLVKKGEGDAFLSAGSTGLVVATATLGLGCLEGIRRPGIGIIVEGGKGPFLLIDVGANPQPKARHFRDYALMGAAYFHDTFGKEHPRVGLLNIGSEAQKGNSLTKEATALLEKAPVEFIGNVEGVELFQGESDVIVCDGFTGNVVIKVGEGLGEYLRGALGPLTEAAGADRDLIRAALAKTDYTEYGGALLLGVKGIVTICHGRSGGRAICNAIRFASKAVGARVNEHIVALVGEASEAESGQ